MSRSAGNRRRSSISRSSGKSAARSTPGVCRGHQSQSSGHPAWRVRGGRMALLRITVALLLVGAARLGAQTAKASEAQVKAVFLFNFAQFVDWPPEAVPDSQAPLVIGILGSDPFGDFLDATVRGEHRGARPFVIRRFQRVEDTTRCDILFISRSAGDPPEEIVARLRNR